MAGQIFHQWDGTVLTITSDSGTSSADLKGAKGDDGVRGPQGIAGSSASAPTIEIPNGFGFIQVGDTQIIADTTQDTFTLAAGNDISLSVKGKTVIINADVEIPPYADLPDGYVIDGGTW